MDRAGTGCAAGSSGHADGRHRPRGRPYQLGRGGQEPEHRVQRRALRCGEVHASRESCRRYKQSRQLSKHFVCGSFRHGNSAALIATVRERMRVVTLHLHNPAVVRVSCPTPAASTICACRRQAMPREMEERPASGYLQGPMEHARRVHTGPHTLVRGGDCTSCMVVTRLS